jgi:hypothetical protein
MSDRDDEFYIQAIAIAAHRHRNNPLISKQLDRLVAMVKLVETEDLNAAAQELRDYNDHYDSHRNWKRNWGAVRGQGAPISKGVKAGQKFTITVGTGTGKSILASEAIEHTQRALAETNNSEAKHGGRLLP